MIELRSNLLGIKINVNERKSPFEQKRFKIWLKINSTMCHGEETHENKGIQKSSK